MQVAPIPSKSSLILKYRSKALDKVYITLNTGRITPTKASCIQSTQADRVNETCMNKIE